MIDTIMTIIKNKIKNQFGKANERLLLEIERSFDIFLGID